MVEVRESKRQIAINKAAEKKKYEEVRADYLKYVSDLRTNKGKAAAWEYVKQFGATKEDRDQYLRDKAKQEYEEDETKKAFAVRNRHQKLKEEQKKRVSEEQANKGVIPFSSSKSDVIVIKTENQLLAQAKLEI